MRKTLFMVRETDLARLFSFAPEEQPGKVIWIPRTVIKSTVKFPATPGRLPEWDLEIDDWWAKEHGLI